MKSLTTKLMAAVVVAMAASAAMAVDSYLYWMVNGANFEEAAINFDYATISADEGSTYLNLYRGSTSIGDALSSDLYAGGSCGNSSFGAPNTGVYAGFSGTVASFLVELWSAGDVVGYQTYEYAQLLAAGNIASSTQAGGVTPLAVSQVVPEPTSGLLMLFGLAGLALRRKRA